MSIVYVDLLLAAVYGLALPNNGKKLYATLERFAFGDFVLAPCFQPRATSHLFGGDIEEEDQW